MLEIEYKYLVDSVRWKNEGKASKIIQGYIPTTNKTAVRVRTIDEKAFLTIKSERQNATCSEFEYEIPMADALEMLNKVTSKNIIKKTRYTTEFDGVIWFVDVFGGENQGLIIAEVETTTEVRPTNLPPWIEKDVSSDTRYYNTHLIDNPFSKWDDIQTP